MKKPLKVLHVEDDANDADLVQLKLAAGGLETETHRVETRDEFVEALAEEEFDLILSDCSMPAFNGLTALRLAHEKAPTVPFIFVSGTIGEEVAAETLKDGAADFVLKDRMNRLLPAVKRALHTAEKKRTTPDLGKLLDQQMAYAVIVRNYENRIVYWNPAAELLYGYNAREAMGQDYSKLLHFTWPDAWEDTRTKLLDSVQWTGRILQRKKDGSAITVESTWVLDSESFVILTIETDVTKHHEAEEALKRYEERQKKLSKAAEHADQREALSKVLNGIATDFNNLLSVMLGYSSMLQLHKDDPQKISEISAVISRAGQRGNAFIRELLAFSHHDGTTSISMDLSVVLDELIQTLEHTLPERIELYYETPQEPVTIVANPSQLRYLLLDLCLHAKILLPENGVTILRTQMVEGSTLTRKFPDAMNVPYVNLTISHLPTAGSPPAHHNFLEEMFFHPERRMHEGIDFAAAYSALNYHRGLMEVMSEDGTGISFQLYFPTHLPQSSTASAERSQQVVPMGDQQTLLVVDDEEMMLQVLKSYLSMSGYQVLTARDGIEAAALYQKHQKQIDLILMDMDMLRTSGLSTMRRIKEFNPKAKVILADSFISSQQMDEALHAGAAEVLTKPYVPDKLLYAIHNALKPAGNFLKRFIFRVRRYRLARF